MESVIGTFFVCHDNFVFPMIHMFKRLIRVYRYFPNRELTEEDERKRLNRLRITFRSEYMN